MRCDVCGKEVKKLRHVGLDMDMNCYQVKRCQKCADDFIMKIMIATCELNLKIKKDDLLKDN